MTVGRLVEEIKGISGERHVVTDPDALRTYESDGLLHFSATPGAVVLPGSAEEVQAIVRACHEAGVPFVARGAGSGLSGGALPVEEGVLIVLSRMNRILEVDLANQRVMVEPGVTNIAVSNAVGPGLFYPPDPSSQIVCSIGGNVAENSGGAHCFKYGFTTNYVTGLEVVLSDGQVVAPRGQGAGLPGLRPARRLRRLGGHARRGHEDHAARHPPAGGRAHARRVLRDDDGGRRGGLRRSCRRGSCRARSR